VLRRSLCKPSLCKPSFGGTASDHDATRLAIWAPPAASAALLQADGKCHKCLGTLVISAPSTWSSSLSPHFPASGEATTLVSPTEADVRGFGTCLVRFRGGGGLATPTLLAELYRPQVTLLMLLPTQRRKDAILYAIGGPQTLEIGT
jgi:hypothetical protein